MSNETYTGGEHYWIGFNKGSSVVYMEDIENNVIVYRGNYEDCINYINKLVIENADFDLDL